MSAQKIINKKAQDDVAEIVERLGNLEQDAGLSVLHASDPTLLTSMKPARSYTKRSRFIYIRSIEHYLSLFPRDDSIEITDLDPCDMMGWDLRKALFACLKGNPTPLDWARLPDPQQSRNGFSDALVDFAQENGDPIRFAQFHLDKLLRQKRRFEGGGAGEMVPEKLIELLKPALSLRWYSQNRLQGLPPAALKDLLEDTFVRPVLRGEITELLERQENDELKELERVPATISDLILSELDAGPALATRKKRPFTHQIMTQADRFFLRWAVKPL